MFKKLRTVIYHVKDLPAARDWYIRATGIQPYFDEPFYIGFDINGSELGLDPDYSGIKSGNQSVAYWAVDSVDEVINNMTQAGASVAQPKTNVGGEIQVAILTDPFGNSIGGIQGA